jgi:copper chaperone CopZ
MRTIFGIVVAGLAFALVNAPAAASDVVVKGPHVCCGQCVKAVMSILGKVEGVSEADADAKTKTVTFKAINEKSAKAGFDALRKGGFFGTASVDGKEIKLDEAFTKEAANKVASVSVVQVHACCGQCHTAIKNLFKDAKVSIEGSGAQRTINIEGPNLSQVSVLLTLRRAGFNGFFEK